MDEINKIKKTLSNVDGKLYYIGEKLRIYDSKASVAMITNVNYVDLFKNSADWLSNLVKIVEEQTKEIDLLKKENNRIKSRMTPEKRMACAMESMQSSNE